MKRNVKYTFILWACMICAVLAVACFTYVTRASDSTLRLSQSLAHLLDAARSWAMFGILEAHSSETEGKPPAVFSPDRVDTFKDSGDWCSPHHVPESMCTLCNPELIDEFKSRGDWCGGHDVPESVCALCNPALAEVGLGLRPPDSEGEDETAAFTAETVAQLKERGDWCPEHSFPESICVRCNPGLIADFKERGDWCHEHDVPESLCADCNPDLAEAGIGRDWCPEHGLPESQCVFCHPELALETRTQDSRKNFELDSHLLLKLHTLEEPVNNPDQRLAVNPNCKLHNTQILLASPDLAAEVGIEVRPVRAETVSETLTCYGEVQYNRLRFVLLSARSPGIVRRIHVDLGDVVAQGDVLAVVDSVDLGQAKADYLRAVTDYQRWKWLNDSYRSSGGSGAFSRKERLEARANLEKASIEVQIAAQALRNLGLDDEMISHVRNQKDTSTFLPVAAPFEGTAVALNSVVGEVVERGEPILTLADPSSMWLMLDVFVKDLHKLKFGQKVEFEPDGLKGETFYGTIDWISTSLDEKTRTAQARAVLSNRDGRIQAGLFGKARVTLHEDEQVVTVPRSAVQWDGCCNIVFVQITPQRYQPRKVRIGYATDEIYVIDAGLLPGERVVTTGSYLFKTEILKGSIGAGCVCGA